MDTRSKSIQYRSDVDGLRAIAILSVLVFHFFPEVLPNGFLGVDVFFVISGFLITKIIQKEIASNSFSFVGFYTRRIVRLYPALLLVLVSTLAFGWAFLLAPEFDLLSRHTWGGTLFVANILLFLETTYWQIFREIKPLFHLWSLGVEEQFYFVWPLLLLLISKLPKKSWVWLGLLTAFSFASIFWTKDSDFSFYIPTARAWQFGLGALVAVSPKSQLKEGVLTTSIAIIGLALLFFGFFFVDPEVKYPLLAAWPVVLGTSLVIFVGLSSQLIQKTLGNPVATYFGLISYPLYLWHWPVAVYFSLFFAGIEFKYLGVALSFLLATLTYELLEKPIRSGQLSRSLVLKGVLITSIALVVLGLLGVMTKGKFARSAMKDSMASKIDFGKGDGSSGKCTGVTGEEYLDDWCYNGESREGSPNVVAIGDSFSRTYYDFFNELGRLHPEVKVDYKIIARGQCPGLLGYGHEYCRRVIESAFEYIKSESSVKVIFLTANWKKYYQGYYFREQSYKETAENFLKTFEATILELKKLGKRIVFAWAPPSGILPHACVDRWSGFSVKDPCWIEKTVFNSGEAEVRDLLVPILTKLQIATFDPHKFMCESGKCLFLENLDSLVGGDGVHMADYGARRLAQRGNEELKELIVDELAEAP